MKFIKNVYIILFLNIFFFYINKGYSLNMTGNLWSSYNKQNSINSKNYNFNNRMHLDIFDKMTSKINIGASVDLIKNYASNNYTKDNYSISPYINLNEKTNYLRFSSAFRQFQSGDISSSGQSTLLNRNFSNSLSLSPFLFLPATSFSYGLNKNINMTLNKTMYESNSFSFSTGYNLLGFNLSYKLNKNNQYDQNKSKSSSKTNGLSANFNKNINLGFNSNFYFTYNFNQQQSNSSGRKTKTNTNSFRLNHNIKMFKKLNISSKHQFTLNNNKVNSVKSKSENLDERVNIDFSPIKFINFSNSIYFFDNDRTSINNLEGLYTTYNLKIKPHKLTDLNISFSRKKEELPKQNIVNNLYKSSSFVLNQKVIGSYNTQFMFSNTKTYNTQTNDQNSSNFQWNNSLNLFKKHSISFNYFESKNINKQIERQYETGYSRNLLKNRSIFRANYTRQLTNYSDLTEDNFSANLRFKMKKFYSEIGFNKSYTNQYGKKKETSSFPIELRLTTSIGNSTFADIYYRNRDRANGKDTINLNLQSKNYENKRLSLRITYAKPKKQRADTTMNLGFYTWF